ncbi:hypothetical protein, partial [Nocardia tengchongensis]|uniref:hypothetical protein n=1 Tax=Nocardia tengchongensis TaxID=2055889 RepID=UPI00367B7B94
MRERLSALRSALVDTLPAAPEAELDAWAAALRADRPGDAAPAGSDERPRGVPLFGATTGGAVAGDAAAPSNRSIAGGIGPSEPDGP